MALEKRKELVLLAHVVTFELAHAVDGRAEGRREPLPLLTPRRPADGFADLAQRDENLAEGLVLAHERVDGVPGRSLHRFVLIEGLGEDLNVHIAEALHLGLRDPLLDEPLLHGRDLGRVDVFDQLGEAVFQVVWRGPGVQLPDDSLELLLTRLVDVGEAGRGAHLGHDTGDTLDLSRDVVLQLFERHAGHAGSALERRHTTHGAPQDGVGQLLELGVVVHEVVDEEGVLLHEGVDRRLSCDDHVDLGVLLGFVCLLLCYSSRPRGGM